MGKLTNFVPIARKRKGLATKCANISGRSTADAGQTGSSLARFERARTFRDAGMGLRSLYQRSTPEQLQGLWMHGARGTIQSLNDDPSRDWARVLVPRPEAVRRHAGPMPECMIPQPAKA